MKRRTLAIIAALALTTMTVFTGCGSQQASVATVAESGVIKLSVNPEIEIEYDKNGTVVDVRGRNDDGIDVVSLCDGYEGQDCEKVLTDLINKIHEQGYFIDEVDGSVRKIVIELEEGSYIPDENFLRGLGDSAREAAAGLTLTTNVSVNKLGDSLYGDTDYGPNNDGVTDFGVTDYNDTDYGPNSDGVTDFGVTDYKDTDYGPYNDGVTDYNDTDYGPNNDGVTDFGMTDYKDTDYGPNNDGVTDFGVTDYNDSGYDD